MAFWLNPTSVKSRSLSESIEYSLVRATDVTLEIFDVRGRLVSTDRLGLRPAGVQRVGVESLGNASGVYLYRLRLVDPADGSEQRSSYGKLVLVR